MKVLLTGGRLIDPLQGIDEHLELLVVDGKVAGIGRNIQTGKEDILVIDVTGCIITPGLIDMHTHLREPGFEYRETIATGCAAAVTGGFTAVACMPNTKPVNDNCAVTEFILGRAARAALARVYPIAAITRKSEGTVLAEFQDLREAGTVGLSDDGRPVMDSALMRRALEYANSLGMTVISHCEDSSLTRGGAMNEGLASTELGLAGIPAAAEEIMVARDIILAEYTGTAVHIAHVSTAGAVRLVREAKLRGVAVTAETAPHYWSLTEDACRSYDTNTKVNPPLRSAADVMAVKEGLRDGTIDAIASDHAPHASTEKEVEFDYALCGIVGLETSVALSLALVTEGILSLPQLVAKMSARPAQILKIAGGTLREGEAADLTVIDPLRTWQVEPASFRSKGRNTPFKGWSLTGKAVLTMVGGRIVHREL